MKNGKLTFQYIYVFLFFFSFSYAIFAQEMVFQPPEVSIPVTHLQFLNDPDNFQFAVIADRNGGERPGIFEPAMAQLNLLRPEFVINVGDSIAGYVDDRNKIEEQWNEFDSIINQLEMPFFRIVGNHDINYPVTQDIWHKRYGMEYFHFVYKNVLFLCLSTDDPPISPTEEMIRKYTYYQKAIKEEVEPEKKKQLIEEYVAFEYESLPTKISSYQINYFKKVLSKHPDVRWTFVFLHKPAWEITSGVPNGFEKIEALLADRPYTVIAGHEHSYRYLEKNGRDYIRVSTVGGGYPMLDRENTFDHIMWVSMTDEGPVMCNILISGILGKNGKKDPRFPE